MPKRVTAQQASQNALALYLRTQLNDPRLQVESRWPDPKRLPERAITVVPAGPRSYGDDPYLGWWHAATKVNPQPAGLPLGMIMWRWVMAWYQQPIQLDLWCLSDVDRDDLLARMDDVINAGPGETLPNNNGDPLTDYLVLPLAASDGWPGAFCCATFTEDGPEITDTLTSSGQMMYRARWSGLLEFLLTVDKPNAPISKLQFKQWLQESGVSFSGNGDLLLEVDSGGVAHFSKP